MAGIIRVLTQPPYSNQAEAMTTLKRLTGEVLFV